MQHELLQKICDQLMAKLAHAEEPPLPILQPWPPLDGKLQALQIY